MQATYLEQLAHFLSSALGTSAALLTMLVFILVLKSGGWKAPLDPFSFVDAIMQIFRRPVNDGSLNVEFRGPDCRLLLLGPRLEVTLRNGHGGEFKLREGVFRGCNPEWIKAGTWVHVTIQGLIHLDLSVQLDESKDILFVQSPRSRQEIVGEINGGAVCPAAVS
jgi:hypothetical protein